MVPLGIMWLCATAERLCWSWTAGGNRLQDDQRTGGGEGARDWHSFFNSIDTQDKKMNETILGLMEFAIKWDLEGE